MAFRIYSSLSLQKTLYAAVATDTKYVVNIFESYIGRDMKSPKHALLLLNIDVPFRALDKQKKAMILDVYVVLTPPGHISVDTTGLERKFGIPEARQGSVLRRAFSLVSLEDRVYGEFTKGGVGYAL